MAKTKPTPAKTTRKAKANPAPVIPRESRYLRGARIIVASGDGDGIDIMRLVTEGQMSKATAGYILEAYRGVTQALREGGLLKRPANPKRQPVAPAAPTIDEPTPEPVPADAA